MTAAKQIAVVIIGDEILEGSTVDLNSTTLINWAAGQGHQVVSVQTIGDEQTVIIEALRRARVDGAELIITTGGVGPTIDDLTVESVGRSQGMTADHELPEMLEALSGWIGEEPTGVRRRTAMVPIGTRVVFPDHPRGGKGWPVFVVGDTYCLPGIPRLVETLLALLPTGPGPRPFSKIRFNGRETQGARAMEHVAAEYPELAFGSYPPTKEPKGWVSLTVRGDSAERVEAATQALLEQLSIDQLETERIETKMDT
jgi:molybdenum cofactor synthesis domain-containing protein